MRYEVFAGSCSVERLTVTATPANNNTAAKVPNAVLAEKFCSCRIGLPALSEVFRSRDQKALPIEYAQSQEKRIKKWTEFLFAKYAVPELPQSPVSASADLWVLGNHKLLVR
jgi:hypothetical protein